MNICGLSDSLATLHATAKECPHCRTTSRIARGLCLACLLRTGADDEQDPNKDDLETVLAALPVADISWRLGNYQILEEIGRGGMGVIYRARQRHSRRIVALKRVLSYHADSRETLARFRREAEAAASLDHPNILPIYEVGESEEGVPYFSMKFAPGGSLQEAAPALRGDPRKVAKLMAKVTRAVAYAHGEGILHRDLKPGNILLDGRNEPLVSDFGLAKWLDASTDLTRTLTVFGTPGFIAPEQAEGSVSGAKPAADIYSLGAILFDLLAGRPPFLGEHALAVIRQAAEMPAPKLRSLVKGVSRDLETICARCLEREPAARYRSATDLADDLERWLEGRPIIARPVSPLAHTWRWARRKPALAASVAGLFLLGGIASVWQLESRRLAATVRADQLANYSITVLPFLDLDRAEPDSALALTVAQSLRDELLKLGPVRVTPVSRSSPYWSDTASAEDIREANRPLHSSTVLTGSKRVVEGKLRISVRLVGAATGESLLARSVGGIPNPNSVGEAIQVLAKPIDEILQAKDWSALSIRGRDPGLRNDQAREFIVAGRQLMFRDSTTDLDRSMRCLEEAIRLEPKSALAHAYLAASAGGRIHFKWDAQLLARAEREARRALALEPELPDAHRCLAGVLLQRDQFTAALEEQLRAVETGGAEELVAILLANTYKTLGQPLRALDWLQMARHWSSRPGECDTVIGDCWTEMGDDERAEDAYHRAADLRPEFCEGWVGLCHLRLLQGKIDAARRLVAENRAPANKEKMSDPRPDQIAGQVEFFGHNYAEAERIYRDLAARDPSRGVNFYGAVSYDSALGRLQQLRGDPAAGLTTLRGARRAELQSPSGAESGAALYRLAAISAALGESAPAFDYLKRAIVAGWTDARSPRLDPRFDAIRSDPRFAAILSDIQGRMDNLRKDAATHVAFVSAHPASVSPEE
jgi:serine/threonine protein kinase/tetratricopeptide (TPR) repeat protein